MVYKKNIRYYLLNFAIVISILSIIIPIITLFIWSFANNYKWPDLLPTSYGMRGIEYVIKNSNRVLDGLKNSIIISVFTTTLTTIISIPCARALAFENFRGKRIIEILIISPLIIPMVSIAMGLNIEFIKLGLSGTYLGVIIVSILPCIPYSVSMLRNVFEIVGEKIFQQGYVLGGSRVYVLKRIVLPMILPGILSSAIMCYIISFSQYFLVYLIGGGRIITLTMDMFPFIEAGDRTIGSLYGIIFIFTTLVLLIVMEYILKRVYLKDIEDYKYI